MPARAVICVIQKMKAHLVRSALVAAISGDAPLQALGDQLHDLVLDAADGGLHRRGQVLGSLRAQLLLQVLGEHGHRHQPPVAILSQATLPAMNAAA